MALPWEPKETINLFVPFEHQYYWEPTSNFGDPGNFYKIFCDIPFGLLKVKIITSKPIEEVGAFLQPQFHELDTESEIYKYYLLMKKPKCPQPKVVSKTEIEWEIYNPRLSRIYNIVFFYENGTKYWKRILGVE